MRESKISKGFFMPKDQNILQMLQADPQSFAESLPGTEWINEVPQLLLQ